MSGGLWSAAHVSIKEVELSSAAIFHERKPDCLRVLAQAFQSTTHQLDVGISQSITDLLVGFILKRLRGMSEWFQENDVNVEIFCRYGWNLSSVSRFVRKISLAQFGFLLPAGIWNARRRWHWSLGCASRDASEFINIYIYIIYLI